MRLYIWKKYAVLRICACSHGQSKTVLGAYANDIYSKTAPYGICRKFCGAAERSQISCVPRQQKHCGPYYRLHEHVNDFKIRFGNGDIRVIEQL